MCVCVYIYIYNKHKKIILSSTIIIEKKISQDKNFVSLKNNLKKRANIFNKESHLKKVPR